jgi:demethylmenaquinone methyltransferase/2-methoxy-6-polyprenyl-1,4-benzoquinol methylase
MTKIQERDDQIGRVTVHSESEYERYASMTAEEKQEFLRLEYEERDATDPYATSRDYNARELEILAIKRALVGPGLVLDLGCGNGYTLLALGAELEGFDLTGIDFSPNLIDGAHRLRKARRAELKSVPDFIEGDAIAYLAETTDASLDYVITERFIQNMPSRDVQLRVLGEIHRVLRPGGRLLMCEGSATGFEALNGMRAALGLPVIPATSAENVSAIRFDDADIERYAVNELGFELVDKNGFSTFFLIARVLHPLLVAPDSPRFDAPINDFARQIQEHAPMDPGFGSNNLWVLQKG